MKRPFFSALAARLRAGTARFSAVCGFTLAAWLLLCAYLFSQTPAELPLYAVGGCAWGTAAALTLRLACERYARLRPAAVWLPWVGGLAATAAASGLWQASEQFSENMTCYWNLCYWGLLAAAAALACWLLCRPENQEELFGHLISSAVFAGALALVVMLGLLLCLAAADALLVSLSLEVYLAAMALPWIVLATNLFCALLPGESAPAHTGRAYRAILTWAALPVALLLLAVLYGYIGKILVTWHMPSGQMNWFASVALAAYLCFWLGLRMVKARPVQLFLRWGWALLLPVLAVQLVGIVIRLRAYGLTTTRCLGLFCLAAGLIGLVLAALGKGPRGLYLAVAVLALVATVSPLNAADLAGRSQAARLDKTLRACGVWDGEALAAPAEPLSEADQETVRSCWRYLRSSPTALYDSPLLQSVRALTYDNYEQALGLTPQESAAIWDSYSLEPAGPIDISAYRQISPCTIDVGLNETDGAWPLTVTTQGGYSMQIDATDYFQGLLEKYEPLSISTQALLADDMLLALPDGNTVYLTRIYLETENGVLCYAICEGILLLA